MKIFRSKKERQKKLDLLFGHKKQVNEKGFWLNFFLWLLASLMFYTLIYWETYPMFYSGKYSIYIVLCSTLIFSYINAKFHSKHEFGYMAFNMTSCFIFFPFFIVTNLLDYFVKQYFG